MMHACSETHSWSVMIHMLLPQLLVIETCISILRHVHAASSFIPCLMLLCPHPLILSFAMSSPS